MEVLFFTKNDKKIEKLETTYLKEQMEKRVKGLNATQVKFKKKQFEIRLRDHAHKRWNERIGPKISYKSLYYIIKRLFQEPDRIIFLDKDFGLIDNDILFTYYKKRNIIHVTTFYGRVQKRPYLANLVEIRKWNARNKDAISLKLSDEELLLENLPLIAEKCVYFEDKGKKYKVEEFYNEKGEKKKYLWYLDGNPKVAYKEYSDKQRLPKFVNIALKEFNGKEVG